MKLSLKSFHTEMESKYNITSYASMGALVEYYIVYLLWCSLATTILAQDTKASTSFSSCHGILCMRENERSRTSQGTL